MAEIGAGTGAVTALLHPRGIDVIALDNSTGMLEQLRRKAPAVRTVVADATVRWPFDDVSMAGVVMASTLHHLADHAWALREAKRVLRRGGRAVPVRA